jgi:hypothetical protein
MKIPNLALDVDGVLANFCDAVIDRAHVLGVGDAFPSSWRDVRQWDMCPRFHQVMEDAWKNEEFWMSINPMPNTSRILTPGVYLTARPIHSNVTQDWLEKHGFPFAPVVTVSKPEEKLEVLKELDFWLVDDHYQTIEKCTEAGIKAYLFSSPIHRSYDLKHLPTVRSLEELMSAYEGENKTLAWRN